MAPEHGFTDVDRQEDLGAWLDVLDAMRREPVYRAYQERVRDGSAPITRSGTGRSPAGTRP